MKKRETLAVQRLRVVERRGLKCSRRTHNPLVPGSSPGGPTLRGNDLRRFVVK